MKRVSILIFVGFLVSCGSSNRKFSRNTEEKPPDFFGQFVQNTTSYYNSLYNAELLYENSLIGGEEGFKENYDTLFPPSIQDALAQSGQLSGNMDEIIKKTATQIEKKPYAKWVDDHFLLNGIAQYINGNYKMAEKIFRYTSTEYQYGVINERVSIRQKERGISEAERRKEEAEKRKKELEAERDKLEREQKKKEDERKKKVKDRKKRKKVLSRDEQFKAKEKARKEGKQLSTKEIVKEIKEENDIEDIQVKHLTDEERDIINRAPTLENKQDGSKESKFGHQLAAKDALLWLAKTYITIEDFIAAQAVLTTINEDPYFPERLNAEYYLTYADMYIRLQNYGKAIEYIQLAIDSSPRNQKGRLYYLKGQLFEKMGDWTQAETAFATVQKYKPYYDMIYHANMQNIEHAYEEGDFKDQDYTKRLKNMTRDAKNDDFLDEIYFYLGEAYNSQGQKEEATKSFEESIEYSEGNTKQDKKTYFALGNNYYELENYKSAAESFTEASKLMTENDLNKPISDMMATSLGEITLQLENIHKQDSLLQLASLPIDEQKEYVTKQVEKEMRKEFRKKLDAEGDSFGNSSGQSSNSTGANASSSSSSNAFYFYDLQQSVLGYTEFKQKWGDRPNKDNWRRIQALQQSLPGSEPVQSTPEEEVVPLDQQVSILLKEIPNSPEQKKKTYESINTSLYIIGRQFIEVLGENEKGLTYLRQIDSNASSEINRQKNELIDYVRSPQIQPLPDDIFTPDDEVEQLYDKTYAAYEAGDYETSAQLSQPNSNTQNNKFSDKFAFIYAMSKGQVDANTSITDQLNIFINEYPNSPLVTTAKEIISQ